MILEHIGLTVSDLERSIRFYTEVLGFTLLRKTITNAYLHLEDQLLELTQCNVEIEPPPPLDPQECEGRMRREIGITHLGFRVDDMDTAVGKLERLGGVVVTPPYEFEPQIEYAIDVPAEKLRKATRPVGRRSWKIAVLADPDGILLELIER